VFLDAHRSWRHVKVTEHRTARDFAVCMRDLADIQHPNAELVRVVMDNLSTHNPGALYETFPAPESHRILQRLEFHYIPKHASWLNMVEIEIGVLRGQCLDRRLGEREVLINEIYAWQRQRNMSGDRIRWKFTTQRRGENWHAPIQTQPRSQNHYDEVLGASGAQRPRRDPKMADAARIGTSSTAPAEANPPSPGAPTRSGCRTAPAHGRCGSIKATSPGGLRRQA
jgi:hypothetical protein